MTKIGPPNCCPWMALIYRGRLSLHSTHLIKLELLVSEQTAMLIICLQSPQIPQVALHANPLNCGMVSWDFCSDSQTLGSILDSGGSFEDQVLSRSNMQTASHLDMKKSFHSTSRSKYSVTAKWTLIIFIFITA